MAPRPPTKRITLAKRKHGVPAASFMAEWPRLAVLAAGDAPADVRPFRVSVCTTVPEAGGPAPPHDGAVFEWFRDRGHAARFETWRTARPVGAPDRHLAAMVEEGSSPVLLADEVVLRGADWLERRWAEGGPKLKHVALAQRAEGLSPEEFSRRWKDQAGQVRLGGASPSQPTRIPDDVRGLAYVQNHPQPRPSGAWAYDAVNEVYFDDVAGLRRRVDWFEETLSDGPGDALFPRTWTMALRETPVVNG
jgi:hypothetical protein